MGDPGEACRLCGSRLQGSQRRWLFRRAPRGPDLRALLTQVCREVPRRGDGRGEFLCGKCAQALARVFRFDAVMAGVRALARARLRRLREEKERLARCLRHLHARPGPEAGAPQLRAALALAGREGWAEPGPGCHGLRVPDAEYEGGCGTPRRLGAGPPALPLCREKSQSLPAVLRAGLGGAGGSLGSGSLWSLAGPEPLREALRALEGIGRRGVRVPRGSRIPVLARRAGPPPPSREMEEEEEEIEDEFIPLGVEALGGRRRWVLTGTLAAAEELRSLRGKMGGSAPEDAGVPSAPGEGVLGVLTQCLHSKEAALQDCLATLGGLEPLGAPGGLTQPLCKRLRERDQEAEHTLLAALGQGQAERGSLQGALQDKDRDLGRLAAVLRTGEQTMQALRETLAQREMERALSASLWGRAQETWRRRDQTRARALAEMGEVVAALRAALAGGTEELEEAAGARGGLLAEALAARARLAAEMDARLQGALAARVAAEQELQDQLRGCTQALAERAREAGALRGRLARQEAELARLRGLLGERDHTLAKAARAAEEKDRGLQKLLTCSPGPRA